MILIFLLSLHGLKYRNIKKEEKFYFLLKLLFLTSYIHDFIGRENRIQLLQISECAVCFQTPTSLCQPPMANTRKKEVMAHQWLWA